MTRIYVGSFQPQFRTSLTFDYDINGNGDGIYTYSWDEKTGQLTPYANTYAVINPARLCYNPVTRTVYAASDTNEFLNWQAGTGGGMYSFALSDDGKLHYRDSRSSCGVRAVDICCNISGKYVLCVNEGTDFCTTVFLLNEQGRYEANIRRDEGCVTVIRIGENGFQEVCDRVVLAEGTPAHPVRIHITAENYLFILNRSGNAVHCYQLNAESGKLTPISTLQLCASPKGFAFHPSLPCLYVSYPDTGEVQILRFHPQDHKLQPLQKVFEEEASFPGILAIAKDGRTLYAADDKTREIKIYGISTEGKLVLLQRMPLDGQADIGHSFYDMQQTPGGNWLLCTDMFNDAITVYRIEENGRLGESKRYPAHTPTGMLMP